MNIDNYLDFSGTLNVSGLIFASGSFGLIDGDKKYTRSETEDKTVFEYINDTVKIKSEFTIRKNDAGQRLDRFVGKAVPILPESLLQKYIRLKRIKLNNKSIISTLRRISFTLKAFIRVCNILFLR